MSTIWFNQGYAVVRDAMLMIREGAAAANVQDLRLLASHADPTASVLETADLGFLEPPIDRATMAGATAYAIWCAECCFELGIDLFIVQGGQPAVAQNLHLFPAATRVVLPASVDRLATIRDKAAFHAVAHAAGLPMPWTRAVATPEDFDLALAHLAALGLPACVKPRESVFGAGFWQLDPAYDLLDALMGGERRLVSAAVMREALTAAAEPARLLVMEFLPGPEWSLDCVCDDGRLVTGVARRKLGRMQELETDGPIFAMATAAIDLFKLSGQINVQFKAADLDGGDPRLLEINPRMSGGMARTRFAGVNLPWIQTTMLLGLPLPDEQPEGGALVGTQEMDFTVGRQVQGVGRIGLESV